MTEPIHALDVWHVTIHIMTSSASRRFTTQNALPATHPRINLKFTRNSLRRPPTAKFTLRQKLLLAR
jgi:hypothetical protein